MTTASLISRRAFIGTALALSACRARAKVIEITGLSMGTTYDVVVVDHDNQFDKAELKAAIDSALLSFNQKLSNWDGNSEISRFNAAGQGNPVMMSAELAHVMKASAQINAESEGRFDTSIGPLIELWGFGAPGQRALPSQDSVALAREMSGQTNTVALAAGQMAKRQDDAQVYLAGIGKGYGADYVGEVLSSFGSKDFLVEIGGDLFVAGHNPDGLPWQVGIESPNPADRSLMGVVGLSGLGLATSGDYRNYFEVDGQRYSHLIDPTTGYPVTHKTTSATVLHENAMMADAWSTAMLILGREKGLEIAARHDLPVQFIDLDRVDGQRTYKTSVSQQFQALTT
ncbi:MAG: FAD:protein FMN transferase [Pseudomonadota bacterium]